MKNLIYILLALFYTAVYTQEGQAQITPKKDRVVQWAGTVDTLTPAFQFDRWTGYLTANESTHQLTFRDPITGMPSIGSAANLPISTAQAAVNTLKSPLASPAFTGLPTTPTPTGSTGIANKGYVDGLIKRIETYSGATNASGAYTVTFGSTFPVAPNIQANIIGGSNTNLIKITSVSTTGFTVNVVNRVDVLGILPTYANVTGANVDVLISAK